MGVLIDTQYNGKDTLIIMLLLTKLGRACAVLAMTMTPLVRLG